MTVGIYQPQIWGGSDQLARRNLLLNTATLATQNVTVLGLSYTLYIKGTGSVTLSGAATGTLNGTGAGNRVSLQFTPTAGTLTLTVSGSVTEGHLTRTATTDHSYQAITDWTTEVYAYNAQRQLLWLWRNRFVSTATLATQTVSSVTASQLTVSFTGTGTITFSGAYSGSLVGTGASDRVQTTFTPSAGNLTCTVTGSVTLAQCENAAAATAYQDVGASWPTTYTSLAQAAGYPITLYLDRFGTIAVDSPETVVGVELDLSKNTSLGANLVSNGGFDSDTAWTKIQSGSATTTISGGKANLSSAGVNQSYVKQDLTFVSGRTYLISFDVTVVSGSFYAQVGGLIKTPGSVSGTYRYIQTYSGASPTLYLSRESATGFVGAFDNVSVQEIAGNHLVAPTDAARPLLKRDGNGNYYLLRDLVDDSLNVTLPNYGNGCVTYQQDAATCNKATGVTLNGATSFSTPAVDYARVLLQGPSSNDAKIQKYLNKLAGL